MISTQKLLLATVLAGSIGLAAIGISRAETATAPDNTETTTSSRMPMMGRGQRGAHLETMAEKLKMTTTELKNELDSGKEMYQISAEHGLTFAEEQADRLAQLKTKLDDMVKVGYMTQAESDSVYNSAKNNPTIGFGPGGPHAK